MKNIEVYEKQTWKDHIVERPGTFLVMQNLDGTITLIPEEGEILEDGTPHSEGRMNHMEEGIYNASIQAKTNKDDIINHSVRLAVLEGNAMNNIGHNMFIVNFANLDSVELVHGVYDEAQKRLVI